MTAPGCRTTSRAATPVAEGRVRASLGVRARTLRFATGAGELSVTSLVEVAIDAAVQTPPDRDELRALCDQHGEVAAIRAALAAR